MRNPGTTKGRILAVVEDLFFATKIREVAQQTGVAVEFTNSEQSLWAKADDKPVLVIVDLNFAAIRPLSLIAKIKGDPAWKQTSVLGFVSHVQAELKQQAQQAGCDMVLARSSFSRDLPQILSRQSAE